VAQVFHGVGHPSHLEANHRSKQVPLRRARLRSNRALRVQDGLIPSVWCSQALETPHHERFRRAHRADRELGRRRTGDRKNLSRQVLRDHQLFVRLVDAREQRLIEVAREHFRLWFRRGAELAEIRAERLSVFGLAEHQGVHERPRPGIRPRRLLHENGRVHLHELFRLWTDVG
jgi:hypothetical protein